jgi:hypothetical protein
MITQDITGFNQTVIFKVAPVIRRIAIDNYSRVRTQALYEDIERHLQVTLLLGQLRLPQAHPVPEGKQLCFFISV